MGTHTSVVRHKRKFYVEYRQIFRYTPAITLLYYKGMEMRSHKNRLIYSRDIRMSEPNSQSDQKFIYFIGRHNNVYRKSYYLLCVQIQTCIRYFLII